MIARSSYFVEDDSDLRPQWISSTRLRLQGRVLCQYGIHVDVNKLLIVNELNQIRTVKYKYAACFSGDPVVRIVRYDNAHPWEGHSDEHYKHIFNPTSGLELDRSPFWVGRRGWPTMRRFMDEVYDWYNDTGGLQPVQIPISSGT